MVTNVHITRIQEKTSATDFVYENDTFTHPALNFTDCPDNYPAQNLSTSWDSFLTGQQKQDDPTKQDRKFPIRIFTIQTEA